MTLFEPECMKVNDLAVIDLSFNKLTKIPNILGGFKGNLNLSNNNFWFTEYSNLSYYKITEAQELMLAYQLNLVSTYNIEYAIKVLDEKKIYIEKNKLIKFLKLEHTNRGKYINNTFNNCQNIHLTSVQKSTEKSIIHVMLHNAYTDNRKKLIKDCFSMINLTSEQKDTIRKLCYNANIHPIYKVTFYDIFSRVFSIILQDNNKEAIIQIFQQDLIDSLNSCYTGIITRMVGSLNGFVTGISISISVNEEISNSILAIRNKYANLYKIPTEYYENILPVVWQLLEDHCIPENEHNSWLEYL
jgi:hypothetical protein